MDTELTSPGYRPGDEFVESEHECAHCTDYIRLEEDVQVLLVHRCDREHEFDPPACLDPYGDYYFTPYFMHLKCWEEVVSDIEFELQSEEAAPIILDAEHRVCECSICGSMLRQNDPVVTATLGELHRSKKTGFTFGADIYNAAKLVCPRCIIPIQEEKFPAWDELQDNWHGALLAEADWCPEDGEEE